MNKVTTSAAHGIAEGDVVEIDMRRRPRFMPNWFWRYWRNTPWQRKHVRRAKVSQVTDSTFEYSDDR